ncbi:MAG TPA: extracellular solute-binding protein [Rectinemataceae bacterium]|nr:extracellular solute-binding protein [Rectinemataceae bacterium]
MNKRILSGILVSIALFCLVAGAGAASGRVPLTVMMFGDNTPTPTNSVKRALEEKLGVDLTYIYVPEKDYAAKLNTLIASRTLPDIFWVDGNAIDAVEFREQGMIAKLDSLLKSDGPDIMAEVGSILKNAPLNQGSGIYGLIPASLDYTSNLSVRADWLAKLKLKMPTNLDELYKVLAAFTNGDPDGNGKKDTVGYVGTMANMRTFEHIFGAYGIAVDKPYLLKNGTVTTYMKAPAYLDAIKYLRKLYQDGILDPDFVTIPLMSAFEKLWTGRTGIFDFQNVGTTNNWMPGRYTEKNPSPTFGFTVIAGPGGKGGAIRQYPRYTYYNCIASSCKNPEKAMEYLNYQYSEEGDRLTYLGIEGLHYEWVDKDNGKYKLLGKFTDQATYRADGSFVYNKMFPLLNTEVRTLNKQTREGQAFARDNSIEYPKIIKNLKATSEYGPQLANITKEAFAQLIVSKGNIETEYAAFVKRWNEEGGLEFEKEATAVWAAQVKASK